MTRSTVLRSPRHRLRAAERSSPARRGVVLVVAALLAMSAVGAMAADEPNPVIETEAQEALVVDGETGTILLDKNPDKPFPPASLAKMMTMEVVFEAIASGRLALDTEFPISVHAWRTGGAPSGTSTMFADVKSNVSVENLIHGAIIHSANDACIALAEGIAGSEEAFAELMNRRAAELGMTNSRFVNPTGLPAEGQHVTVRDLVTLARHIRTEHPELYAIYSKPDFKWNKIFQRNRNPLLAMGIGADGMETGYTEASGYALLGVTNRGGRVTYLAMSGLPSSRERAEEARRLLDWSNEAFAMRHLYRKGAPVGSADVFGGEAGSVSLVAPRDIRALLPREAGERLSARIRYDGPIAAPVEAGAVIAALDILVDGKPVLSEPLAAGRPVAAGSFSDRAMGAVGELAFGWLRGF
ncbi:D-alanyl-D-alanine carboxypeptidase family protein [Aurantimonas sp. 22II-16-19i]|uniref:D-alanyl-D-alanine carboxypeptidase family protein n=1 Tax=Aurantimonas sp. 22II-16-19i TaxID=1317114 RepID=UPI0009F7DA02|nr:D-alanyl-D-alanine carboxypeptidase family protein [Aurantimonas sp. 22II-16-19i]ORE92776.1 D-alanyl-D-alanine carboxypeptidase [Aurantimonas sp. 22II-16-19i]